MDTIWMICVIYNTYAKNKKSLEVSIFPRDRKSTRLNSSHGYISYAVFCLKKKKNKLEEFFIHVCRKAIDAAEPSRDDGLHNPNTSCKLGQQRVHAGDIIELVNCRSIDHDQ